MDGNGMGQGVWSRQRSIRAMNDISLYTRPLPYNIEAEEATIGSLMIDNGGWVKVIGFLTPAMFYREKHQWVAAAMLGLHQRGEPSDPVTLTDELERIGRLTDVGGPAAVSELLMRMPTAIHLEYYARIVERHYILRRIAEAGEKIARLAYEDGEKELNEILAAAESELFSVTQLHRTQTKPQTLAQLAITAQDRYDDIYQNRQVTGVPTASHDLNDLLTGGGYQRKKIYVLAARPKMGKTSRVLCDMAYQVEKGYNALFFSLEMDADAVTDRLIASRARVNLKHVIGGPLSDDEYDRISTYAAEIVEGGQGNLIVCDQRGMSPPEMEGVLRWAISEYGRIDIVYADHLQEIGEQGLPSAKRRSSSTTDIVSEKMRYQRNLAGKYDVAWVVPAQLNREVEKRQDKTPTLSDLKDSGGVEETADVVMFLYRDEYYNPNTERPGVADIIVAAQRNGPTGKVPQRFQPATGEWGDLVRPHQIEQASRNNYRNEPPPYF